MSNIKNKWAHSYVKKLINRNYKILNSSIRKADEKIVNLHWWSMQKGDCENVGDFLSSVIYNHMLKECNISPEKKINKTRHLYGVGSIIQGGAQSATIWGSGLKDYKKLPMLMRLTRKLDVRLVRGPETRKVLLDSGYECPEAYGDPALIMPLIYKPKCINKTQQPLVVLHKDTRLNIANSITPLISNGNYTEFIDKICNASVVISSSLHGIILAEAYGVPAVLLKDTESDNLFKYNDYYYSTGRFEYHIAESVEEALNIKPSSIPDLKTMQENILKSFPYDLWKK